MCVCVYERVHVCACDFAVRCLHTGILVLIYISYVKVICALSHMYQSKFTTCIIYAEQSVTQYLKHTHL